MKILSIMASIFLMVLLSGCANSNPNSIDRGNIGSFERSNNYTSHGYTVYDLKSEEVQKDDKLRKIVESSPNGIVERFYVKDGDCANDDCGRDRERSELSEATKSGHHGEKWIGWNIYLPKDYEHLGADGYNNLGQFHSLRRSGFMQGLPLFLFKYTWGTLSVRYFFMADNIKEQPFRIPIEIPKGQWNNIKIHVNWSTDIDVGFFKAWFNDKLILDYKGRTISGTPYAKYGLYRGKLKWQKKLEGKVPDQRVYYSNFKVADSKEGLEPTK